MIKVRVAMQRKLVICPCHQSALGKKKRKQNKRKAFIGLMMGKGIIRAIICSFIKVMLVCTTRFLTLTTTAPSLLWTFDC